MTNIDTIIEKGNYFYKELNKENSRFKSWEYCYKTFQETYKNKLDEKNIDYLSLHLSFYLASWGMYRGSSFLLELDYKVHKPVVEMLFDYKILWDTEINKDPNQDLNKYYDELFKLIENIKEYYNEKRKQIKNKKIETNISDTLISKILLGTIGCIPAFDTNFKIAIDDINISFKTLNKTSIKELTEYYKKHYDRFEELRNKMSTEKVEYPPMKILDSCLWQYGLDIKKNSKK